jgi:branched-chain amino acid transport system permease protein
MVAVGGIGSFAGAVTGAFVVTLLPEYLRAVDEYRMVIFGAMLVAFMGLGHRGLAGLSAAVAMRLLRLRPQPRAGSLPAHRWSRQ